MGRWNFFFLRNGKSFGIAEALAWGLTFLQGHLPAYSLPDIHGMLLFYPHMPKSPSIKWLLLPGVQMVSSHIILNSKAGILLFTWSTQHPLNRPAKVFLVDLDRAVPQPIWCLLLLSPAVPFPENIFLSSPAPYSLLHPLYGPAALLLRTQQQHPHPAHVPCRGVSLPRCPSSAAG